jgi:hypothetical protein
LLLFGAAMLVIVGVLSALVLILARKLAAAQRKGA